MGFEFMAETMDKILQEDLEAVALSNVPWEFLENRSILITGATGLIGAQIVKALLCRNRLKNAGMKIFAAVRNREKAESVFEGLLERENFQIVVLDLESAILLEEKIDYIIHTASPTASKEFVTRPVEVIRSALEGTRNVLEFAQKNKARGVVYLSSMEAFGVVKPSNEKSREENLGYIDIHSPRSSYSESKRMAECLCAAYASEYNVPVKIARLSQTFGAGIHYSENRVFAQFAKSAIEKKDIVLHTSGCSWGNYCYTRDTVRGILLLLVKGNAGEAYTITNEESNVRIKDMAALVAEKIAGGTIQVIFDIPKDALAFGYAPDTELHLSGAKMKALGFEAEISLEESYRRMIESMKYTK